jgi:hypothetical protein
MTQKLSSVVRTANGRLRPVVRTVEEALGLIDCDLPPELRMLPRWTFARELLVVALQSGKKRDHVVAVRQLRQALSNEGWLAQSEPAP